jgi:hypothetical protein
VGGVSPIKKRRSLGCLQMTSNVKEESNEPEVDAKLLQAKPKKEKEGERVREKRRLRSIK